MPSWNEVLIEINDRKKANPLVNPLDHVSKEVFKGIV